jgi:putative SOS response-associated peptidase YedK
MEAVVFVHNHESSSLETSVKVWGLITKPGTKNHPLVEGMGKHFEALMYNARTDTLMEKATFGKLVNKQQSCIVAVNGWFEWKQELKGKKQPYFCTAKNQQYVLFPGLWTTTQTGVGDETLTTFTILTTDAAPCLQWLHTRMPVCCWNTDLAHQWLQQPTSTTLQALEADNVTGSEPALAWHAVTPDMTNLKYRSDKAIQPLKRATVTNFFSAVNKDEAKSASAQKKRPAAASTVSPAQNLKKASIADFFSPKSK